MLPNNSLRTFPAAIIKLVFGLAALVLNLSAVQQARAGAFFTTGSLSTARYHHTATLLPNAKVLVAGGVGTSGFLSSAELYSPGTGWVTTGPLNTPRNGHTATLLPNGKVLIAGGYNGGWLASAELFDPFTGTWTATGSLNTPRTAHTATLLPNGQVLITGGYNGSNGGPASAELYDPVSGTWTTTGSLTTPRTDHTATVLPNGQVLIVGGYNSGNGYLASSELYDPVGGTWTTTGSLNTAREDHTTTLLPNGKILVAGGLNHNGYPTSAELYDPAGGVWTTTGSLNNARQYHTATLLPDGQVLVGGGAISFSGNYTNVASSELYDPVSGKWTTNSSLNVARRNPTATLLPSGDLLIVGGYGLSGPISSAELYDSRVNPTTGTFASTGSLKTGHYNHTTTLLPNGKALVAGGFGPAGVGLPGNFPLPKAELYDPASGTWANTGSMHAARAYHTATLLANGKVLVAGGAPSSASSELYDPVGGTWTTTGNMHAARSGHTATLLANGKMLVAGGGELTRLASTELYDPSSGTWTVTGSLNTPRSEHTATLLPNGKVLIAGGVPSGSTLALGSTELYDPTTGAWTTTGIMHKPRATHTATLLADGKVLVAGGGTNLVSELFDPVAGTWTTSGSLSKPRTGHSATLLPNGQVLVIGGQGTNFVYDMYGELYDPSIGTWMTNGTLNTARISHTATLLTNGQVLVTAGDGSFNSVSNAEVFDVGLGCSNSWRPQITSVASTVNLGSRLTLAGSQFRGLAEGSGGNGSQDSPADYPLVKLHSLGNEQTLFLSAANWSTNSFYSIPVTNFPAGYALVTVFVNGIPSSSSVVDVIIPTSPWISMAMPAAVAFQLSFTNMPGFSFSVLSSPDSTAPFTNWTLLGVATDTASPGQYQFTDSQSASYPQRFYRLRWP
jgi:uncharacterized delta-60 repeat protein